MSLTLAISDTCMFILGACFSVVLDYIFSRYKQHHEIIVMGLVQIICNAYIIKYVNNKVQNIGLFTLGILTFQSLLVKKLI